MTALIAHKYTLLNESGEPQAYGYLEDQRSVLHNQPVPEGDVIMEIFDVSPRGEAYYIDPVEESRDLYTGSHSSTPWGDIAPAPSYYCPFLLQHTAHLLAVGGDDDSDKPIPTIAMHNPRTNRAHSGEAHSKSVWQLYPKQGTELCTFYSPVSKCHRKERYRSNDLSPSILHVLSLKFMNYLAS